MRCSRCSSRPSRPGCHAPSTTRYSPPLVGRILPQACPAHAHATVRAPQARAATLLQAGVALFIAGEFGGVYHHVLLARMRAPAKQAQLLGDMSAARLETPTTAEAFSLADDVGLGYVAGARGTDYLVVEATPTTASAVVEGRVAPPAVQPQITPNAYVVPRGGLFSLVTTPHYLCELAAWLGVALVAQQLNALLVFAGLASYLSGRAVATTRWYRTKFGKAWPAHRRHLVPFVF